MQRSETARSYKVLVVEDEGLIAHDIAGRLEALGHEVVGPASTAEEAIEQAPACDIVLMDIHIDGHRDGIDAAAEIRSRHRLPVIFLTAHADRSTLDRAKLAGPFGYIVKPIGPASLQTGIELAITRHRAERLLEEREAWLGSAIASIADAAVITGSEGHVRLLNRAAERLTGWTQAEAEGQPLNKVLRLIDADSGLEEIDFVSVALLRDAPVQFVPRCRLLSRDGRELEIEGAVAPVRLSKDLLGAVTTFRDASARRWEERQLRQAQRVEAAGRLARGAANEYTHRIAVIRKQAERLLLQFAEYSPARSALEEIHQAAIAADQITRRLAAFGARQVGQPEILSLNGLLRRMAGLIGTIAGDGVRVAIQPSPGAGRIRADLAQIETAVMSLVTHACSTIRNSDGGTGDGGEPGRLLLETARVEIPSAGSATEYVLLSLTYSGLEPDVDHLFDAESIEDSGLELAAVHSIVAEWGGYLSARPGSNGGSRIEMLLPCVIAPNQSAGHKDEAQVPATVLLVDDRPLVRAELHNFFETAGYNLLEAADASEAVALVGIHEGALDLIIAEERHASTILDTLSSTYPAIQVLRIVDSAEKRCDEIRRPYTQRALLEKAAELVQSAGG